MQCMQALSICWTGIGLRCEKMKDYLADMKSRLTGYLGDRDVQLDDNEIMSSFVRIQLEYF